MNYELVEIESLSGVGATIYSVKFEGEISTEFDKFLTEYSKTHREEIKSLLKRIQLIGKEHGARRGYFKLDEGKPGDGVAALYDEPEHKLRLYCIRYGSCAVILGGGGPKPEGVRAWQEDIALSEAARNMITLSDTILKRLKEKEIKWSEDGYKFIEN